MDVGKFVDFKFHGLATCLQLLITSMGGSRGGGGGEGQGVRNPWNCQIINFCHVEIFRQTPSGTLDPPLRKFSGSAHDQSQFYDFLCKVCQDIVYLEVHFLSIISLSILHNTVYLSLT